MNIHFISINTLTNIPSVRFIADFFIKKYKTSVIITERALKNENNYYSENKNIIFDNIDENINLKDFKKQSVFQKIKKYYSLIKKTSKILKSKQNTVIISPDFQVLFFVFFIKHFSKNNKTKVIYLQFELFEYPGKLNNYLYKKILAHADKIDLAIFPEKNRKKHFYAECKKKPKQFFILPNTCEPIELKNKIKRHSVLSSVPEDALIIGHVGNVGGTDHFFSEIIKAAEILVKENIYFIFIGNQSDKVKKIKKTIKNKKILFFDKIPHQELSEIYPFFDLGLILYKGITPNFEFAAPNKLYEYWAYGIPVLAHKLKGLADVFKKDYMGYLIDMQNEKEIIETIISFKKQQYDKNNIKNYFNENLKISLFFEKLDNVLI